MTEWVYDFAPDNPIRQRLIKEDGNLFLHSHQDVQPVLDYNGAVRNIDRPTTTKEGTAVAAKIPAIFYWVHWPQEFKEKFGYHPKRYDPTTIKSDDAEAQWGKFLKGKLNDPDFSKFRTDKPGMKL